MKHKFLFPFVTATSLTLIAIVTGALTASAITIDSGLATRNHVQILRDVSPENALAFDFWPTGDHPNKFNGDAVATVTNLFGTTTASAAFTSQLNPNRFVWSESFALDITASRVANATLTPFILFTVEDPVSYSMSGSFGGSWFLSASDGSASLHAAASLFRLRPEQPSEQIESFGINFNDAGEPFGFEFGGSDFTGVLQPGSYEFNFGAYLQIEGEQNNSPIPGSFANGTGQFEFRLDRLHGNNHVPDAGSTLTMLGMALGGLGFIRHRI